jgi:plastocyanin
MRKVAFAVACTLLASACGGSSTGVKPTQDFAVTVTNSGFSPATLTVPPNSRVTWTIAEGTHNITFTQNVPNGGDPSSGEKTAPASVSTVFLQTGTYPYSDADAPSHTGSIVVQ